MVDCPVSEASQIHSLGRIWIRSHRGTGNIQLKDPVSPRAEMRMKVNSLFSR